MGLQSLKVIDVLKQKHATTTPTVRNSAPTFYLVSSDLGGQDDEVGKEELFSIHYTLAADLAAHFEARQTLRCMLKPLSIRLNPDILSALAVFLQPPPQAAVGLQSGNTTRVSVGDGSTWGGASSRELESFEMLHGGDSNCSDLDGSGSGGECASDNELAREKQEAVPSLNEQSMSVKVALTAFVIAFEGYEYQPFSEISVDDASLVMLKRSEHSLEVDANLGQILVMDMTSGAASDNRVVSVRQALRQTILMQVFLQLWTESNITGAFLTVRISRDLKEDIDCVSVAVTGGRLNFVYLKRFVAVGTLVACIRSAVLTTVQEAAYFYAASEKFLGTMGSEDEVSVLIDGALEEDSLSENRSAKLMKIEWDINIKEPTLTIPRHSRSHENLVASLGRIRVTNEFSQEEIVLNSMVCNAVWDTTVITFTSMCLRRHVNGAAVADIVPELELRVAVRRRQGVLESHARELCPASPNIVTVAVTNDIEVTLTHAEYDLAWGILNGNFTEHSEFEARWLS